MNEFILNKILCHNSIIYVSPLKNNNSIGVLVMLNRWGRILYPELVTLCSLGKNGVTKNKREGDKKTPMGVFSIKTAFGIHKNPNIILPYTELNNYHYFVDDPKSKYYNTLVDISKITPDFSSAEYMLNYKNFYEYGLEIKYNEKCVPYAGSAVFLHCTEDIFSPTSGCIGVNKKDMKKILKAIIDINDTIIAITD